MSRRYDDDRYDDRQSNVSRRTRNRGTDYDELDVNIREARYDGPAPSRYDAPPPPRQRETVVKERETDTVMTQGRRTERGGPRQPDFLREDYGRNANAGQLVVRDDRSEDEEYVSRAPTRRRSMESTRSRPPPQRTEREEITIRETTRDTAGPPYPRSERGSFSERDEVVYRDRARSARPPPSNRGDYTKEEIDIRIRESDGPSRPPPPRSNVGTREVEEISFRRGEGSRAPPAREETEREEITISRTERGGPPPPRDSEREEFSYRDTVHESQRGRGREEEIDINIRDRSAPPPRQRSMSRGVLVKKDHEEWVVRRRRTPSPSPSPPPPMVKSEQIIIRRKERSPSPEPEPPREPSPEPLPPPPEPIYRPPIIQEVITHHRHIDHGIERARSPTPPPAPAPPSPPKDEDLEISIRRQGTRNGKSYDEEITFERDVHERGSGSGSGSGRDREVSFRDHSRGISRQRSAGPPARRRYEDDVSSEADYYNRRVTSRGYPGEAYNGATKDWGLVDIPPGTERVELDGVGGGRQELTWSRYTGDRKGKFYTDDRVYEQPYGNGAPSLAPPPPPAPLPPPERTREEVTDIRITERSGRGAEAPSRRRTRDKMWTEVTKDLVIKEAIEEKGYEYEETEGFFYVMEYLQYEDVLKLVETTEDIRRERRERLQELAYQRNLSPKMMPPPPPAIPPPPIARRYDEQYDERDYYRERRYR